MIFVTLGTQKFQMNRLMAAADSLALEVDEEICIQSGNSTYKAQHCIVKPFMSPEEYKCRIEECSLLITHAGVGTIITGLTAHKRIIVVPRLADMHEHVDDHQVQIAEAFSSNNCVLYCNDLHDLKSYVEKARTYHFEPYEVKGGNIESLIMDFIGLFE